MLLSAAALRHPRLPVPSFLALPLLLLSAAYLYKLSKRPTIPDHIKIANRESNVGKILADFNGRIAGTYGFPSWYGAGPSPFDAKELEDASRNRKMDILLFIGVSEVIHYRPARKLIM